jgi:hypothetical protein
MSVDRELTPAQSVRRVRRDMANEMIRIAERLAERHAPSDAVVEAMRAYLDREP